MELDGHKGCVLFADDSRTARAAASKALQEKYTVIEASDGNLAWQNIKSNADIDIVFVDIHMPQSNGLELLAKIRASNDSRISSLPVVVITGIENSEAAMRVALNMGATDFISKPFKNIDLLSRAYSYIALNNKIKTLEATTAASKTADSQSTCDFDAYARKSLSFANRYKKSCIFALIEIEVLDEVYLQSGKGIYHQIVEVIDKRVTKIIREEDLFAQVSTRRFGLVLPVMSRVKSHTVIQRILSSIDKLAFDVDDINYRLNSRIAVYTSNKYDKTYEDVIGELESAISPSGKGISKVVSCGVVDSQDEVDSLVAEEMLLNDAFIHALNGDYQKILGAQVKDLSEKLVPFMNYANSQDIVD